MRVVVVPYRDRRPQLRRILPVLERVFDRVIICEQIDGLPFNRGAVRNLGFVLAALPPDAVVCFHDVDLLPDPRCFRYRLDPGPGTILHLYGHRHCLGGIVVCRAGDFGRAGGYPTALWSWGGEDVALEARMAGVARIDRTALVPRFDPAVAELDVTGHAIAPETAQQQFLARARAAAPVQLPLAGWTAARRPVPLHPSVEWWTVALTWEK